MPEPFCKCECISYMQSDLVFSLRICDVPFCTIVAPVCILKIKFV